ncbi:MAG: recombination mediator RecR [bacterium]
MKTSSLNRLIEELKRLPGIGSKTAQRLAFFLMKMPKERALGLARAIEDLKEKTRFCARCGNLSESELCGICSDSKRDPSMICVVQEAMDVMAIDRTGEYRGQYHVLNGALSPMDAVGPEELNIQSLVRRLELEPVKEVILATNPTIEGEATAMYLLQILRSKCRCKISRIARGIPIGGHLEYADEVTLSKAMEGRSEL